LLLELARDLDRDNIVIISAGLAFFALLSTTPLLGALVSIYGLVSDPSQVEKQVNALAEVLPHETRQLIADNLKAIVHTSRRSLGLGAGVSVVTTLWAGSKGVFYLLRALNIAAGVQETRGFLPMKVIAFLFTVGTLVLSTLSIALVALLPLALKALGLGTVEGRLLAYGRWPVLTLGMLMGLELLYRYGPAHKATWRGFSPGTLVTTAAWIILSLSFSNFVELTGRFKHYGGMGAGVSLLLWLFLSAFLFLVGAELNAKVTE
jgi:membrane protein